MDTGANMGSSFIRLPIGHWDKQDIIIAIVAIFSPDFLTFAFNSIQ